jgi:hypothetical protein
LTRSTETTNAKKVSRACFLFLGLAFPPKRPLLPRVAITFTPYVCHKCAFSAGKASPRNLSQSRRNKNATYVRSSGRRIILCGLHLRCRSSVHPYRYRHPRARRRLLPTPRRRPLDGRTCRTPTRIPASASARHRASRTRTSYAREAAGRSRERRQLPSSLGGR